MQWITQIRERIRAALDQPLDPSHVGKRINPFYLFRLTIQIGRQWVADRCPQQAATLAFQTILSLVPLIAVGLGFLYSMKLDVLQSALKNFIGEHLLPVSGELLVKHLIDFAENIRSGALGPVGIITTFLFAYMLFHTLERIFNDIWRVRKRRGLVGKMIIFYPLATLTPPLFGLTLYYTSGFWRTLGMAGLGLSVLSSFVGFFLANKLIPKTKVSWRAATYGSLVSAILFELAKHAFQLYVQHVAMSSFTGVYGALGLIPLTLLWIYYSWLVILFGAEVAYTIQNLHMLEEDEHIRLHGSAGLCEELEHENVNGYVAARLMLAVAENFANGQKVLSKEKLVRQFGIPAAVIDRIFEPLIKKDLVLEVQGEGTGYMPAKPLAEIGLLEVLDLFFGQDLKREEPDILSNVFSRFDANKNNLMCDVTFSDLVAEK
ncbi:MAG: YhjD/YihY/BrkB family envelope integrity protein [Pseudomonadota bacterium]